MTLVICVRTVLSLVHPCLQVREQNRAAAADAAARKERQKKAAEEKRRAAEFRRKVKSVY